MCKISMKQFAQSLHILNSALGIDVNFIIFNKLELIVKSHN
ncbi:hypothetical protein PSPO_b1137 [Pseudoalteromonas spongiae UST010723-006]|nr:hypothetical protein PSPO_b1137 [Pseudoalteromonas spongiae UST010723-006]